MAMIAATASGNMASRLLFRMEVEGQAEVEQEMRRLDLSDLTTAMVSSGKNYTRGGALG